MIVPLTLSDLNTLLVGASINAVSFTSSSVDISLINEDPTATSISTARIDIFCEIEVSLMGNLIPTKIKYGLSVKNSDYLISEIGKKIQRIETTSKGITIYVDGRDCIDIKFHDSPTESFNFYCTVDGKNRTMFL